VIQRFDELTPFKRRDVQVVGAFLEARRHPVDRLGLDDDASDGDDGDRVDGI
jgi:hypothetical protein